jgi:hypothetical protein
VPFAFVLETTLRVELLSVFLGCRQIILGAIDGNDRHSMPKIGGVTRPKLVGQLHRIFQLTFRTLRAAGEVISLGADFLDKTDSMWYPRLDECGYQETQF